MLLLYKKEILTYKIFKIKVIKLIILWQIIEEKPFFIYYYVINLMVIVKL